MAKPTTREEFKEYCLRKLGKPVLEINVDDDQVEDRIDEALSYYHDYHFDGTQKVYLAHQVTEEDKQGDIEVFKENFRKYYANGFGISLSDKSYKDHPYFKLKI